MSSSHQEEEEVEQMDEDERSAILEALRSDNFNTHSNDSSGLPPANMWPQYLCAVVACMGGFLMGTTIGWSAPAVHQLQDNSTAQEFDVTPSDCNWIGSLMPAGALVGSVAGGWVTEKQGRKGGMYVAGATFLAGYLFLICAHQLWYLYVGRFVCGIGSGLVTTSSPIYLAEIASPHVRGLLGSGFQVFITIGIGYVAVLGFATTWRWISVSCVALIAFWFVIMLPIPESPTYLLSQKDFEAGRSSLKVLRGSKHVERELSEIQNAVEMAAFKTSTPKDLLKRENLRPLLIALFLMFGQQFSGINAIFFYSVTIFQAAHTSLNDYVENIVMSAFQITFTILGSLLIDKAGRRVLLLVSAAVMCTTIAGLGAYFYLKTHEPSVASKIGLLPLVCLCFYVAAFSIGFGPIPWLMTSEIMAPEMKSQSNALASASNWVLAFVVTRFFGEAQQAVGASWTYWGFAISLALAFAGVLLFVPETKGRSLQEIRSMFGSRNRDESDGGGDPIIIIDDDDQTEIGRRAVRA